MLSRQGAQDVLSIYVSPLHTPLVSLVLPSTNAQSLSWSPCGRWLVILESQLYTPAAYTYTAGGHPFRSYPQSSTKLASPSFSDVPDTAAQSRGPRCLAWSHTNLFLISGSSVSVLTTRTFSLQRTFSLTELPVQGWQETISANNKRNYVFQHRPSLPTPLPLTHAISSNRPNSRPTERQLALSANGRYLALLDPATPTSISVFGFNTDGQVMHTLLSQYAAVRSLSFSPHVQNQLLLVAETGVVYTWAADADAPPMVLEDRFASVDGGATRVWAEWIGTSNNPVHPLLENGHDSSTSEGRKPAILISSKKKGWVVIWPDGRPRHEDVVNTGAEDMQDDLRDDTGDVTEDSLYEVLTGSPSKKSLSRHMDGDEEADDERLDDTFREKKVERAEKSWEDDSEIF